ncbi:MAG: cytochrome c oxidase subunit II [Actinomycetota bacterium]|nr:cytochrome c oxidase subunit II [Actinomycetota bacterium]
MPRILPFLKRFAALSGTALFLTSCSWIGNEDGPLTTFKPAGPNADRIDGLFWLTFWIATVIFFLVMGALVVMLVVFRDKGDKEKKLPKQTHGHAGLEVVWTVIPALILAAIAVPTVTAVFDLTGCEDDSMRVEVTGHQWWFEYHYPDQDIDTANVMVIPVGQEVCAEMTSADVLHNFWVPALHGKRYLVPGQTTELRLEADETGEFWGHCAEFCGLSHSLMRARVQVVTQSEFDAWVSAQQKPTPLPAEGTPEGDGYQVFTNKGCVQCHTVRFDDDSASNVIDAAAFNGPDLTHFASRDVFAGASLPEQGQTYEQALKAWLADPPNIKPGSFMPNLALTSQEIDDLIVWLESNK